MASRRKNSLRRSVHEVIWPLAELGNHPEVLLLDYNPIGHEWPPAMVDEALMTLGPVKSSP